MARHRSSSAGWVLDSGAGASGVCGTSAHVRDGFLEGGLAHRELPLPASRRSLTCCPLPGTGNTSRVEMGLLPLITPPSGTDHTQTPPDRAVRSAKSPSGRVCGCFGLALRVGEWGRGWRAGWAAWHAENSVPQVLSLCDESCPALLLRGWWRAPGLSSVCTATVGSTSFQKTRAIILPIFSNPGRHLPLRGRWKSYFISVTRKWWQGVSYFGGTQSI